MTTYRPALDAIVAASGHELPKGYDRWFIKSVRPDLRTREGFRWAFPGRVSRVPKAGICYNNTGTCPARAGDGLCVATTYAGMASGGYPARTLLLLAVRSGDVIAEDADKARVSAALTVDVLDGEEYARIHLYGANLTAANLNDAYLTAANLTGANLAHANLNGAYLTAANLRGAIGGESVTWPYGFDWRAAGVRP